MQWLLLAAGCVCLAAILYWYSTIRHKRQQQALGLNVIKHLYLLNGLFQQHRQLLALSFDGPQPVNEIRQLHQQAQNSITTLQSIPLCNEQERWLAIVDHWGRLAKSGVNLSGAQITRQHLNLINNALLLTEDISTSQKLDSGFLSFSKPLTLLWQTLPATVELLHQLTLQSCHLCQHRQPTQQQQQEIATLLRHIRQHSLTLFKELGQNYQETLPELYELLSKAARHQAHLRYLIQTELLDSPSITVSPVQCLKQCQACIDSLNKLFMMELKQLEAALKQH